MHPPIVRSKEGHHHKASWSSGHDSASREPSESRRSQHVNEPYSPPPPTRPPSKAPRNKKTYYTVTGNTLMPVKPSAPDQTSPSAERTDKYWGKQPQRSPSAHSCRHSATRHDAATGTSSSAAQFWSFHHHDEGQQSIAEMRNFTEAMGDGATYETNPYRHHFYQ